jgi:type I restriction enzyme S subunit
VSEVASLADIFEFVRNGKSVKQDKSTSGLPITRIETIASGKVDGSRVGYGGLQEAGNEKWLLQKGDILFSHINSVEHVGKCALYEGCTEKLVHGINLRALRPNKRILDARYAYRALSSPSFRASLQQFVNKAVNQASISTTNLKSLEIPLPPLDEQRRMAAILDKADALRRKRKRAIDLANGLTQSIFQEMFGSASELKFNPLATIIDPADRINYGVVQPGEEVSDGVNLVRVSDIKNGCIDHASLRKVSRKISDKHERSLLRGNEILISCVGSIGEIAVTSSREVGFNIARAVARVPILDDLQRFFIAEYLRSSTVQRYFTKELRTVSQPTLNIKQISETLVPMPPPSKLREFRARCHVAHRAVGVAKAQATGLDALFSSLQFRAFSGQL